MKRIVIIIVLGALLASCATTHNTSVYEIRNGKEFKLKRGERPQCLSNW
jgi:uncharacterized lipoprotein YmbA